MTTYNHLKQAVLPLTLTTAAVTAVLTLADSARERDGISARLDPLLATDAVAARTTLLTRLAHLLTFLGSEVVVGGLALALVAVLLALRGRFFAGCAVVAMGLSIALTVGIKLLVGRPRPGGSYRLGPTDTSYSFPSGHSLNSAVLLGLVVILLVPLIRSHTLRNVAVACALLLAAGIGASRVYLGYHWASDVLASWLITAALLAPVVLAVRVQAARADARSGGSQVGAPSVRS